MSETQKAPYELGDLRVTVVEEGRIMAKYDRMAISRDHRLMMASVVCGGTAAKAIRAALNKGGRGVEIHGDGARLSIKDRMGSTNPGNMVASHAGYHSYFFRLEYDQYHVLFVSKDPEFLVVNTEESLWRKLKSDRYNTPLLRDWVPYVSKRLEDDRRLEPCYCYRCDSAILTAPPQRIDAYVSEGLKRKAIAIPDPPARA